MHREEARMNRRKPHAPPQIWIASGLSVVGIIVLIMGLCWPPSGEIHSSVLVAYGEVMTFAGALFGIDYHYRR